MELVERRMEAAAKRKEEEEIISIELQIDHENIREKLSHENIKRIFKSNLNYFKRLKLGLETSWRQRMFYSPLNKAQNIVKLRSKMMGAPFSERQQDQVYKEVKQIWLKLRASQLKDNEYIELVLLPEVFLVMYQKHFALRNTTEADERISNLRGSLLPDDISPDTSVMT